MKISLIADTSTETLGTASGALLTAFRSCLGSRGLLIFGPEKILCDAAVDVRPGENLLACPFTAGVEVGIKASLLEAVEPEVEFELLIPGIQTGAAPEGCFDHCSQAAVTTGEDTFDVGLPRFMPFVTDKAAVAQQVFQVHLVVFIVSVSAWGDHWNGVNGLGMNMAVLRDSSSRLGRSNRGRDW